MKIALGLLLAFAIGVVTRVAGIPVPAPPALIGALLVVAMTLGYIVADRYAPPLTKTAGDADNDPPAEDEKAAS